MVGGTLCVIRRSEVAVTMSSEAPDDIEYDVKGMEVDNRWQGKEPLW